MIDVTPITDFNEFFAWYMNIIKSKVDGFDVSMPSDVIHNKIGKLTKEEQKFTEKMIRKIQHIPKSPQGKNMIEFENDNSLGTYACYWNKNKGKFIIKYPSVTYYYLRYPDIIKVAIQHEIGHIVNGDCVYKSEHGSDYQKEHHSCINKAQDTRINQNLNYDTLDYLNRCLFTFSNAPAPCPFVPELYFPKCGLSLSYKGSATAPFIHTNYHKMHPEADKDDGKVDLMLGTYVKTLIDKHGYPAETYGRVVKKRPVNPSSTNYGIIKITDDEIEAIKNDDWKFFKSFNDPIAVLGGNTLFADAKFLKDNEIGNYEYGKDVKELNPLQKPVSPDKIPKEGDIAFTRKDVGSIPKEVFGMITKIIDESKKEYQISEFVDEFQKLIGSGKAEEYFELLTSGRTFPFTGNTEMEIWIKEFIIKPLSPPPPPCDDPPCPEPPEKPIERPQVGDVVQIKKGDKKGKYGVIEAETENGFVITEVSEEVAKAMVSKK
ncbi:MAG: hypothetical protein IPJ01_11745 [Micavibrio sp.]|nr:hypothetical protein [Micavibrio sp.]